MSNAIVPYTDMERMAGAIVKSGLFGMKTVDQALALMCIAQAEGRHPGSVAVEYHIIQGRPALKADTMLARFQAAGGKVQWTEYTDKRVAAIFSHPNGGSVEIDWTFDRAKAAGLTNKDNWRNYPRQMLRARVISEGVRTVYPGVAIGIYTPEEVMDFEPSEPLRAALPNESAPSAHSTIDHETGEIVEPDDRPRGKPATREPQSRNGNGSNGGEQTSRRRGVATEKQVKLIRVKLDQAGIEETELLAAFELGELGELPFDKVNAALDWIKHYEPGAPAPASEPARDAADPDDDLPF